MEQIENSLKILGLNEKERKIVVALLTKKHATVSELARLIKLPRTTVIPILGKLRRREFIAQVKIGGHKEWQIVPFSNFRKKLNRALIAFTE